MTKRKEIMELLVAERWSAQAISRSVHVTEKEVYVHLEHISKTRRGTFGIQPAECLTCGFVFKKRDRLRSPSRCPLCKSEHITEPRFFLKNR